MISTVNSLATNAVTVLTGQKRATVPVEPVAPIKAMKRRTGHTDDVFKAGKVIGSMIAIAAGMNELSHPITASDADGIDDPGTHTTTVQTGTEKPPPNPKLQERGMETVRQHAAGTGPRAEWARAYLEAQERRDGQKFQPTRTDNS